MLKTEFVRNLHCNYERILLEKQPEEGKYQYCMVSRGGIRGLLPCSLRYINNQAYLYYDISSSQNIAQIFRERKITRKWLKDFLWSMKKIKRELGRFLLNDGNLIWYPEQIYQELEKNDFSFFYIPYYEGECGFKELMDFLVDRVDYEDTPLVECVYRIYERYETLGIRYLDEQIYEDAKGLEEAAGQPAGGLKQETVSELWADGRPEKERKLETGTKPEAETGSKAEAGIRKETADRLEGRKEGEKYGFRFLFEGRKKRQKEERMQLQRQIQEELAGYQAANGAKEWNQGDENDYERAAMGVCENFVYQASRQEEETEEFGKTLYIREDEENPGPPGLFREDGELFTCLDLCPIVIGKRKEEANCILEDPSVSRMHARISKEEDFYCLEDLNSTNGTFKNGLRMQPYEKRRLEEEDEIRVGRIKLIYRKTY